MIDQLTVYLENEKGHLARLCRTLGESGVQMHLLMLADTPQYGIARIICDRPAHAQNLLLQAGFKARLTPVAAVAVDNAPGGLAALLDAFDQSQINVEYAYCAEISKDRKKAIDILKIDPIDKARMVIEHAGFSIIDPRELYELD